MTDLERELCLLICGKIAAGGTLRTIGAELGLDPAEVYRRATKDEEARRMYQDARDAATDLLECDILQAAKEVTAKTAQADRVKIDALKWVMGRRAPKRYGDRVTVDNTSSDGSMSPKAITAQMDPNEAARLYADLMKGSGG